MKKIIVSSFLPMYAFQAYSLKFFLIIPGSTLVSLLIMGLILGGWK